MISVVGAALLKGCFAGSAALIAILFLKGKPGMFALGLIVPFVWIFGAARLAKPDSAWAHACYDDGRLRLAHERYAGPGRSAPPVALTRPAAPRELTWAYAAMVGFAVLSLLPAPLRSVVWLVVSLPVAGLVVAFGALAWRGVGWARMTCAVLIALVAVPQLVLLAASWPSGGSMRLVPGTLQVAAAVVAVTLLYRPPARAYMAEAGRLG